MDSVSPDRRSEIMSKVSGKHTAPELNVRRLLHSLGYRFRLHRKDLPGRPDIVLPKHRAVIFVHGCFWHRHVGCPNTRTPKSNVDFWERKFHDNLQRDKRVESKLDAAGWRSWVIWECECRDVEALTRRILEYLGKPRRNDLPRIVHGSWRPSTRDR